jgi:hypothetical protein
MNANEVVRRCRRFWTTADFANDTNPHHLPHCHVYWNGDDHASVVSLPDLVVIVGDALPRAARKVLQENVDRLVAEWDRLNP